MKEISITIPIEYNALTHASDFFSGLAADLKQESTSDDENNNIQISSDANTPPDSQVTSNASSDLSGKHTQMSSDANTPLNQIMNIPVGSVKLDSAGLPYDVRIHTKGKNKITKKDGKWKYARNMTPELINTVEAELRAAMAASPANPITPTPAPEPEPGPVVIPTPAPEPGPVVIPTPAPEPGPVVSAALFLVDGKEYTADELIQAGWNHDQMKSCKVVNNTPVPMTFPEFMAKITPALGATLINDAMINVALNRQGLASLPMLAARPDLIPAIYDELFSE